MSVAERMPGRRIGTYVGIRTVAAPPLQSDGGVTAPRSEPNARSAEMPVQGEEWGSGELTTSVDTIAVLTALLLAVALLGVPQLF